MSYQNSEPDRQGSSAVFSLGSSKLDSGGNLGSGSTDKAAINAPAPKAVRIEINWGLGFVRRATREPKGNETALRTPLTWPRREISKKNNPRQPPFIKCPFRIDCPAGFGAFIIDFRHAVIEHRTVWHTIPAQQRV
jgi:hypothetical protein